MTTDLRTATLSTPLGELRLDADDDGLCGVYFAEHRHPPPPAAALASPRHPILALARAELADYFAGRRRAFTVPLAPRGSEFQRRVWAELRAIPFGERRSYADLARAIGRPGASRAVGAANGRNPISIIVPCHRVIGSDGALRGYAGGEASKRWLLDFEGERGGVALNGG